MIRTFNQILITGGAGFIGSHVVRHFLKTYKRYHIVVLDELTYAGNLDNLKDIEHYENYTFEQGNIADSSFVHRLFNQYRFNGVIHLAAESHVDRSIANPSDFIHTNVLGTTVLLNACLKLWKNNFKNKIFHHISTDEVYGSLGNEGFFTEETPYDPRSPYSASKAASDMIVSAYYHTYQLPILISNCSNNYGPNQFPEKLIPLTIYNAKHNKPISVYGEGKNIRDWLWVLDHVKAIDNIFHHGKVGETYNIGGNNEVRNIDLVKKICVIVDKILDRPQGTSEKLILFVKDRLGHDYRYAIDYKKINKELKWQPQVNLDLGIEITVKWYLQNKQWLERIFSNDYRK